MAAAVAFPGVLQSQEAPPAAPPPAAPVVAPPAAPTPLPTEPPIPAPVAPSPEPLPSAPAPLDPAVPTRAQPTQPEPTVRLTFPNTSVNEILSLYEVLTNKRLIRDSALAQGQPLTIVVPGEVPRSEAIRLIEASLLLNGYSFIPVDDNTLKILNIGVQAKGPRSEGIPIFASPYMLPESDQVVSYFMRLNYIAPQDAAQLFQTFISPPKAFTTFTPVPNVQAVLITENVPVIRKLIALQAMVDVPPAQVMTEFITLKRADAEKVAEVLQTLIDKRNENAPKPGGQPGQPAQPQGEAPGQVIPASIGTAGGGQFESNLVIGETQIVADPRTNRILVVTRPINFPYLKQLIEQLDAPMALDSVLERPLQFVAAGDVLPVLQDLLSEGEDSAGSGATGGASRQGSAPTVESGSNFGPGNNSGSSSGSGTKTADRLKEPNEDTAPQSVIIGKTKIIADKSANSIIVIGPPDSRQKVAQLLSMLDVRPRQVYIAAVIGELSLTDEMEFGLSYFIRNKSLNGNSISAAVVNPLLAATNALTTPSELVGPELFSQLSGLTVYGSIAGTVDIYARALEKTGKFKILSRPVVYTTNNKKAVISSGQEVPYTSSTLTSTTVSGPVADQTAGITANITYKDVLLKLEVVPLINANKDVTLVIVQTNNNILGEQDFGGGNVAPIISAQELTTTVTVPNGGTVVLGGLIVERTEADDSGLPFIMRIPVLGHLFKQTNRSVTRQELIILLQPSVVENDADLARVSGEELDRSKLGSEAFDAATPNQLGNIPVVPRGDDLLPDAQMRKQRDPLRPAGIDYQEYAPQPTPKPEKKKRSTSAPR
ncbi:MAG: secretin N-terminal domain-containing protein [Chthoniobacterales bacterium]